MATKPVPRCPTCQCRFNQPYHRVVVIGYGCLDECHDPFISVLAAARNRDYRISEWVPWSLLEELRAHLDNRGPMTYLPYDKTEGLEAILYRWSHDNHIGWEQIEALKRTVFKTYIRATGPLFFGDLHSMTLGVSAEDGFRLKAVKNDLTGMVR